jgi:GMP synthase-like glutamine amidotransferase
MPTPSSASDARCVSTIQPAPTIPTVVFVVTRSPFRSRLEGRQMVREPGIRLVVSEHPSRLTDEAMADHRETAARLASLSGAPVSTSHYLDEDVLDGATGVVISRSYAPWSAHDGDALRRFGGRLAESGIPALGICAGMQVMVMAAGGTVGPMAVDGREPERGFVEVHVRPGADLLAGQPGSVVVHEDHSDEVWMLPPGFTVTAHNATCPIQAISAPERRWWGTQFHPEMWTDAHAAGERILRQWLRLAGLEFSAARGAGR